MENTQLVADVQRLTDSLTQFPEPVVKPALIAVSGLPGTGKSYFCSKLADRFSSIVLESDALRKILFPSPTHSLQESSRLFGALHRLTEGLLRQGVSLILDATNLSERSREYLYYIAEHASAKLVLVRVEAPPEVVHQRLKARQQSQESNSDADWAIYQKMRAGVQRIRRRHYAVDTARDITPVLDKIVQEVRPQK